MNIKMVKDVAEIKLIPFMGLESSDVILLRSLFLDIMNGIRSEREYFCMANQNASIQDIYIESNNDRFFNIEELPELGVNLTVIGKDGERVDYKKVNIPTHVREMRKEEIGSYSFRLGYPASVDGLDVINNMKWIDSKCLVLRGKDMRQEEKEGNASGALPFCITTEIKGSTQKCKSMEECINYIQCIEIDIDQVKSLQDGSSEELYTEFFRSNLGSPFWNSIEKWNEALKIVKRPDATFEELGNAIDAGSVFSRKGQYLKQLNKALGVLFLGKEDFFDYARSGGVDVHYIIDKDLINTDKISIVIDKDWFKLMLIDRGILAIDALSEVRNLFQLVRSGPSSSAIARIFAHILLSRLPDKEVLITRHNDNMKELFSIEFYDKYKDTIQRGEKVLAGAKEGGKGRAIKNMSQKVEEAWQEINRLCSKGISFTEAQRKAAKKVGISTALLKKAGVLKKNRDGRKAGNKAAT